MTKMQMPLTAMQIKGKTRISNSANDADLKNKNNEDDDSEEDDAARVKQHLLPHLYHTQCTCRSENSAHATVRTVHASSGEC